MMRGACACAQVQDELVEAKLIKPPPDAALAAKAASKGRKASKKQAKAAKGNGASMISSFRQFTSPGGLAVLVGRNNKQNDVLSHQVANPRDLWMHVRGIPGSHTLLRLPPGAQDAAQEDLQFAANLAAYFSKARSTSKVDVIVARGDQLKKLKGGKPGQILVTKEKGNVVARPQDSAAAREGVASAA